MSPQPPEGGIADSSGAAGPAAAAAAAVTAVAAMPVPGAETTVPATNTEQQQSRHKVAIVWFRRDLRVSDNPALMAAAAEADFVVRRKLEEAEQTVLSFTISISPLSVSLSPFSEALVHPPHEPRSNSPVRCLIAVLPINWDQ